LSSKQNKPKRKKKRTGEIIHGSKIQIATNYTIIKKYQNSNNSPQQFNSYTIIVFQFALKVELIKIICFDSDKYESPKN
jgi:hypothetical protein